jgi:hypothetical protein
MKTSEAFAVFRAGSRSVPKGTGAVRQTLLPWPQRGQSVKTRLIILFALLAQGIGWVAAGPLSSNDVVAARIQGSNSLLTLRTLISSRNYHMLGFHSTNEVFAATNGEPLTIYGVVQGNLTNYLPGQSFEPLLELEPHRVIIPIKVGTKVRSSTTLRLQPGPSGAPASWVTANWGQPRLIRDLILTYRYIPTAEVLSGTDRFVVEIPSLDLWFIGYTNTTKQLVLRSTVEMPLGPITIGQNELVTQAAMHLLALIAQRYNGLPN